MAAWLNELTIHVVEVGESAEAFGPVQINARSPNCAHAALIISSVSAKETTGMLPKPK